MGASPIALLSVIGRNMVGRSQVAAPGAELNDPAKPIEVAWLLKGDSSEAAFAALVREHAASGVSGVVPKFLDAQQEASAAGDPNSGRQGPVEASNWLARHRKASVITRRHIVKGSSAQLPFVALNEHLCRQVASRVVPAAQTEISDDGLALVVHRFDVDESGQPQWGMEDFCSLLGLRPAAKYDTTWERIARAVRDHMPGAQRLDTYRQLANTLLLTYALRNFATPIATQRIWRCCTPAGTTCTSHLPTTCSPPACTLVSSTTRPASNSWEKRHGRLARTCKSSSRRSSVFNPGSSSTWWKRSATPWLMSARWCATQCSSTLLLKMLANACSWLGLRVCKACEISACTP